MKQNITSLEKIFRSCSFSASNLANEANKSNDSKLSVPHLNDITSFFVDSSGRSSFAVPLQMTFDNKKGLEELLVSKSFDPPPRNLVSEGDQIDNGNDSNGNGESVCSRDKSSEALSPRSKKLKNGASVSFEVNSVSSGCDDSTQVTVEGVSVLSCSVKNLVVTFQTKVTVRATTRGSSSASVTTSRDSLTQMSPSRFSSSPLRIMKNYSSKNEPELEEQQQLQQVNISARFNITPVLTIERNFISKNGDDNDKNQVDKEDFSPDLTLLGLVAIPDQMQYSNNSKAASSILSTSNDRVHETRLSPITINVTLTNAFSITVQSIPGPKSRIGNTLVSLSIKHSKTHNLPVTITNIAVHPGHSRHDVIVARNNTNNNNSDGPLRIQQAVCKYKVASRNFLGWCDAIIIRINRANKSRSCRKSCWIV